jgi:hypothetical protein
VITLRRPPALRVAALSGGRSRMSGFDPLQTFGFKDNTHPRRQLYSLDAIVCFAAATAIWLFAAGWSGDVPWLPDNRLLTPEEWPSWIGMFLLLMPDRGTIPPASILRNAAAAAGSDTWKL